MPPLLARLLFDLKEIVGGVMEGKIAETVSETKRNGFTLLELIVVVAIIVVIVGMSIPMWSGMGRTFRLRGDVDRLTGMINSSRIRASSAFARVKLDCSDATDAATNCPGSKASCQVLLQSYQTSSSTTAASFAPDTPAQRMCLSQNVSFAVPSTSIGVGQQNSIAPVQSLTLYFNSLGMPITSTGGALTTPYYSMYLREGTSGTYMAIGIAANGKPTVYALNNGTWVANQ